MAQGPQLKSGAAAAQASRVSGAVEQGSKFVLSFFVTPVPTNLSSSLMYFLPLGLLGGYFAWRFYTTGSA